MFFLCLPSSFEIWNYIYLVGSKPSSNCDVSCRFSYIVRGVVTFQATLKSEPKIPKNTSGCRSKNAASTGETLFLRGKYTSWKFLKNSLKSFITIKSSINPKTTQPAITCSKLTIETLEQGVKHAQS